MITSPYNTPTGLLPTIQFNQTSVDQLFQKYEDIGFIYPEKKQLLAPHFSQIRSNWKKALRTNEKLLWILTNQTAQDGAFASISVWRQSNYGLLAQHLVSSGNPFLSLEVMLAAQYKAEHEYGPDQVRSSQNWFRPNNRYAFRIFASMFDKLGDKKASLLKFDYLHQSLTAIKTVNDRRFIPEEVLGKDQALIDFVNGQYGEVFTRCEELDQTDIQLKSLAQTYGKYQLQRGRRVYKFKDAQTGEILACAITNKAPLGANFSFLEHRAYFIIDKSLPTEVRARLCRTMSATVKADYADFPLGSIPIVTDAKTSAVLQQQDATFTREYMQSIWLREGFSQWYEHIHSFLQKIRQRQRATQN